MGIPRRHVGRCLQGIRLQDNALAPPSTDYNFRLDAVELAPRVTWPVRFHQSMCDRFIVARERGKLVWLGPQRKFDSLPIVSVLKEERQPLVQKVARLIPKEAAQQSILQSCHEETRFIRAQRYLDLNLSNPTGAWPLLDMRHKG